MVVPMLSALITIVGLYGSAVAMQGHNRVSAVESGQMKGGVVPEVEHAMDEIVAGMQEAENMARDRMSSAWNWARGITEYGRERKAAKANLAGLRTKSGTRDWTEKRAAAAYRKHGGLVPAKSAISRANTMNLGKPVKRARPEEVRNVKPVVDHGVDEGEAGRVTTTVDPILVCLDNGMDYYPDMDGQEKSSELDATACQLRCARTKRCKHFSYQVNQECHLFDKDASARQMNTSISGPKTCDGDISARNVKQKQKGNPKQKHNGKLKGNPKQKQNGKLRRHQKQLGKNHGGRT